MTERKNFEDGEATVTKTKEERAAAVAQEVAADAPVQETTPETAEQKSLTLDDLKVGYLVGLTEDGNFVFELFGKNKGLVEILGLHGHATLRINQLHSQKQMAGDALVHEVGKAVAILNQKIDKLLGAVAPKQPDNNLDA